MELAGAWWLVSDLCINVPAVAAWVAGTDSLGVSACEYIELGKKDNRLLDMQFWSLTVKGDGTSELVCVPDADEPPAFTQKYTHTKFPEGTWDIWAQFNGDFWVILLPSEY